MGEKDTVTVDQNNFVGGKDSFLRHSWPLPPPPQLSSKVIALPTVLTLGRVAAVPILVAMGDKLMVAATLILLCIKTNGRHCVRTSSIVIIGREITMSAVREWSASQNGKLSKAVAINSLGKWKTATQMIALTLLLASRDSSFEILLPSGVRLLYVSAGLTIWSLIVYTRKIWRVLLKK